MAGGGYTSGLLRICVYTSPDKEETKKLTHIDAGGFREGSNGMNVIVQDDHANHDT